MSDFSNFVDSVRETVIRAEALESAFTQEDSDLVLTSIARIAKIVIDETKRSFPGQSMPKEDADAVEALMSVMRAARGGENLRLDALKKFEAMAGAVS
jgi:hypothetical protein